MGSYRKVGDDILKEWLDFREEDLGSLTCKEDKEHFIYFEEITTDILNNVSGNNIEYVKSQLEKLDDNTLHTKIGTSYGVTVYIVSGKLTVTKI